MSNRRCRLWCPVVVLILCCGLSPAARAEAPAPPVLWDSVLRGPDGQSATGEVVAYVRPPAAALQPGDQLTEVARVQTGDSGRFVLRAFPSPAFRAAQDSSGWVTVMLFGFSKDRVALATDAVAWRPDPGVQAQSADSSKGRWISSPADLIAPADQFRAADAPSTPRTERPETLILEGSGTKAVRSLEARPKPPPDANCGLMRSRDMGIHEVAIGELHLGDAWGGSFEYTNTKSTSFQTGVSYGGRGWQVGGSDSMTATSTLAQGKNTPPAFREEPQFTTYKAELLFKRFEWRCTRNGYSWDDISTLQPVSWPNGGMREPVGGERAEVPQQQEILRHGDAGRDTHQTKRLEHYSRWCHFRRRLHRRYDIDGGLECRVSVEERPPLPSSCLRLNGHARWKHPSQRHQGLFS